jgi:hypothetical protein
MVRGRYLKVRGGFSMKILNTPSYARVKQIFIQFKITLVRLHDRIILERVTVGQKKRSQSANLRRSNLNCPASDKLESIYPQGRQVLYLNPYYIYTMFFALARYGMTDPSRFRV